MILFMLLVEPGTPKEKVRLVNLKGWNEALKTAESWANGKPVRVAEIAPALAKTMFKGVAIEG
jgi:hypothetical protein